MRVYLPLQIVQRELDSRLLIAAHLVALGHEILLGPRPGLLAQRRLLGAGGVYVLSNAERKGFIASGSVDDLALIALDEEVLVIDEEKFVDGRVDSKTLERCSVYLCWGERHRELVAAEFSDVAEKLRIVGNPRIELLRPRFRGLYARDVQAIRASVNGRFVLFNATSGLEALQKADGPSDFLAAARIAAQSMPDSTVVVRPHPALGDVPAHPDPDQPNLVFANTGSIAPWLLAADVVVHPGCTTAIEARLLDRPVIRLVTRGNLHRWTRLADSVSEVVHDPAVLIDHLREAQGGGSIPQPPLEVLKPYFSLDLTSSPAGLIAGIIDGLEPPDRTPDAFRERPHLGRRIKLMRHGPKDKHWSHIRLREARTEISARFAAICDAADLPNAARISFPQPRVMRIRPSR
jgi:hypothetical protein